MDSTAVVPRTAHLYADQVKDRASFARFVGELIEDYLEHRDEWENITLVDFLEALQGGSLEINRHYQNTLAPNNLTEEEGNWRHFADILLSARVGNRIL
jgi:hypothetical protein